MVSSLLDPTYDGLLRKRFFQSKYDLKFKTARHIHREHINKDARLKALHLTGAISGADHDEMMHDLRCEIFNTFKWSQHFLLFNQPEALAAIQRVEADSKFFRSLVVAFLVIAILLFCQTKVSMAWLFIVLSVMCYYRYGELRFKSTEKAYEMIITLFAQMPEEKRQNPPPATSLNEKNALIPVVKTDLTQDVATRHRDLISAFSKGFSRPPKQIVFTSAEGDSQTFIPDKDALFLCVRGRGISRDQSSDKSETIILLRNAIVPLKRQVEYSVLCASGEQVEILSWES